MKTVKGIGLRAAQLHGHESPEDCRWVAERVPVTIRALPAGSSDLERFDEFGADLLLLDSQEPGSGQVFDWTLAAEIPSNRRVVLAGGLDPGNVGRAINCLIRLGSTYPAGLRGNRVSRIRASCGPLLKPLGPPCRTRLTSTNTVGNNLSIGRTKRDPRGADARGTVR